MNKKIIYSDSEAITRYLIMELMKMGYRVECNRSDKSKDTWYIKICAGTWNKTNSIHLRISNHDVLPMYRQKSRFDYDISVSKCRKNSITFIEFLALFTSMQNKPIPEDIANIMSLIPPYAHAA